MLEYLKPYYKFSADSFGYLNDASGAIAEGQRGLREAFDLDAEAQNKVNEFVSYLKGLPTEYFEAKLKRVVALNEFSTAVVPRGADKGLVERLKSLGLQVKFYKSNDSADRLRVVRDAATLFSKANESEAPSANVRQELESILGKLRTRKLLAGGRVTILKAQGEAQRIIGKARAQFSAAWHSSPYYFERFTTDAIGTGEGSQVFGWGLYFASKREVAEWYRKQQFPLCPVAQQ